MALPAWLLSSVALLASMALAVAISVSLTLAAIAYARRRGLIDAPGKRRSHLLPTPRGGGIGIVFAVLACAVVPLAIAGDWAVLALGVALTMVATIGWIDDHFSLPPVLRLLVHLLAASVVVATALPDFETRWLLAMVAVLALAWSVNLHNFMDGIDGLLGLQAAGFFFIVGLFAAFDSQGTVLWLTAVAAAATAAFVPFNVPGARVFLGDVGSGALGLLIAAVALFAWRSNTLDLGALLMLSSASVVDASATLLQRMLRGRRWWRPHREHLYQWLVRSGHSHLQVSLAYFVWTVVLVPLLLLLRALVEDSGWAAGHRELAQSLYFAGWPLLTLVAALVIWWAGRRYSLRRVRNRI